MHHRVVMISPASSVSPTRAKAVWGPGRVLRIAGFAAIAICAASTSFAAGRHTRAAKTHRPGTPNAFETHDKMDGQVAARSRSTNRLETADVIVMLEPGVDLPLRNSSVYSHNGKLNVIHGYVLDRCRSRCSPSWPTIASTHRVHINGKRTSTTRCRRSRSTPNAVDLGQRHQQSEPVFVYRRRASRSRSSIPGSRL